MKKLTIEQASDQPTQYNRLTNAAKGSVRIIHHLPPNIMAGLGFWGGGSWKGEGRGKQRQVDSN